MTTDEENEEIKTEIKTVLYGAGCTRTYCEETTKELMKIIDTKFNETKEKGKKEGIQRERERIREQLKKDSKDTFNIIGELNPVISLRDIDIWDDMK